MARKKLYTGDIIQIRVNQGQLYHRQWAIPRGDKKPYIVSETVQREDGTYIRNHAWVCGCMDWIARRQKLRSPFDRCKHIDAVIRMDTESRQLATGVTAFDNIEGVKLIPTSHFSGYSPKKAIRCNWSGEMRVYYHIISLPRSAIPITVQDDQGFSYPVGYVLNNQAYLSLDARNLSSFNTERFFNILANRSYSPAESQLLLDMEAQRDRMEQNFGEEVSSQIQVFDGQLSAEDQRKLERLKASTTIDDYTIIGPSVVLRFDDRSIKQRNRILWRGDYLILIGQFLQFSIMGKNCGGSSHYTQTQIHPHVNAQGTPCLATYNAMVVKSLENRNWVEFCTIISDFLTQYNHNSPYIRLH